MRRIAAHAAMATSFAAACGSVGLRPHDGPFRNACGSRMRSRVTSTTLRLPLMSRGCLQPTLVLLKQQIGGTTSSETPAVPPHVRDLLKRFPAWQQKTATQFKKEFDRWLLHNNIDIEQSAVFIDEVREYGHTMRTELLPGTAGAMLHVKRGERTILDAVAKLEEDLSRFKLVLHHDDMATVKHRHVGVLIFDAMNETITKIRRDAAVGKVVVLRGESGCGKTITAFLAGDDGVTIYVVPTHTLRDTAPVPSDYALAKLSGNDRDRAVRDALFGHIDTIVGRVGAKIDTPVTLVLDEMGGHALALRAICSTRDAIASKLKTYTDSKKVRIVVAGTGVSQRGYAVGSSLTSFSEIDILNGPETFDQFLNQRGMASLKAALKPAGGNRSPAALALMILAKNRRCAAIIARHVREHVWWAKKTHELRDNQLWQLFQYACSAYQLKNGFRDYTASGCERAFARAFHICITRDDSDLSGHDTALAEKLGLLLDNVKAFPVDQVPVDYRTVSGATGSPHVLAHPAAEPRYAMSAASALLGMSLFGEISGGTWEGFESNIAHVLQIVCAAVANSADITTAIKLRDKDKDGWYTTGAMDKLVKVFEEVAGRPSRAVVKQPCVVCRATQLRLRPADITKLLARKCKRDRKTTSPPREVNLLKLRGWIQNAFRGGNIVVIVNGPAAAGPDIFVAGSGWYVGVQCKLYAKTQFKASTTPSDDDDASEPSGVELAKMDLQLPPTTMQQRLLVVVAGRKPAAVPAALLTKGDFIYLGANTKEASNRLHPLCVLVDAHPAAITSRHAGRSCSFP